MLMLPLQSVTTYLNRHQMKLYKCKISLPARSMFFPSNIAYLSLKYKIKAYSWNQKFHLVNFSHSVLKSLVLPDRYQWIRCHKANAWHRSNPPVCVNKLLRKSFGSCSQLTSRLSRLGSDLCLRPSEELAAVFVRASHGLFDTSHFPIHAL